MMIDKSKRFILFERNDQFEYDKNKNKIDIRFNRIAFIFFFFCYYVDLFNPFNSPGSRKANLTFEDQTKITNKIQRADIVDRNGNFLAKTVSSIDIGINPVEVIDKTKLLLNLRYIFPEKNYEIVQDKLKKKFFWFEKKFQLKTMKK